MTTRTRRSPFRPSLIIAMVGGSLLLAGCAAPRAGRTYARESYPPPPPTQVYAYPMHGQSAAQEERDRYECHRWAAEKSGFDPGRMAYARPQRRDNDVRYEQAPGNAAGVGLLAGAAIGSAIAGSGHRTEGAVLGAIAGTVLGAASEASAQAPRRVDDYDYADAPRVGREDRRDAANFRRAMSACLQGRGYQVR